MLFTVNSSNAEEINHTIPSFTKITAKINYYQARDLESLGDRSTIIFNREIAFAPVQIAVPIKVRTF